MRFINFDALKNWTNFVQILRSSFTQNSRGKSCIAGALRAALLRGRAYQSAVTRWAASDGVWEILIYCLIARLVLATHLLQVVIMSYGYVYLLCNRKNGTLYLGVTTDLYGRLQQHKSHYNPKSFTAQYDFTRLVWFDRYDLVTDAIRKEKTMKGWPRQWKINLIERNNPNWDELVLDYDD